MDNLAHALFGAHLSRLPAFRSLPPRVGFWTAVAAANVPDLDGLLAHRGSLAYLFEHRGVTHSLVGMLLLAPAVALLASAIAGRKGAEVPFRPLLALSFLGVASHLLLDLITSWGTMLLLPFSDARLALPWLFIVDPIVWLLLGLPLLRVAWRRRRGGIPDLVVRRTSVSVLAILALYVALAAVAHERARLAALAAVPEDADPVEVLAFPNPPGPLLWTTLVRTTQQEWHRGWTSALTGGVTRAGVFPTGLDEPRVQVALESELGDAYRWFAAALYPASVGPMRADGSWEVQLGDLRFTGPWREEAPFQLWMELGPDFQPRDWELRTGRVQPRGPDEPMEASR